MARCNLRRLLCLPNQQFCLHCYCSHQTLQMYISDIMPPLQDRSRMAVLSSGWWSRVWIFYNHKVNSVCEQPRRKLQKLWYCRCCHLMINQAQKVRLMGWSALLPQLNTQQVACNTALQSCVTCSPFCLERQSALFGYLHWTPGSFFPRSSREGFIVVGLGNFKLHKASRRLN